MRTLLLLIAFSLAAMLGPSAQALKPEADYRAIPSDYGILYREVRIRTSDRLTLYGWFYPAQDTAGIAHRLVGRVAPVPDELKCAPRPYRLIDAQPRPTIVICPGDAGNMSQLILYAYHFSTHGFNVLTFDWRGFGDSDPWKFEPDALVCTEFLEDLESAIDLARSRPETDRSRIGLFGFSTGAYLSFAVAAKRHDIRALVTRALLTSFDDLFRTLKKAYPERQFRAPSDYPVYLLPVNAAPRVTTPTLLVVGKEDDRTPPWMSERVYSRLAGPKQMWVVKGAGHGGKDAPELAGYPEFFKRVVGFFEAQLMDGSAATQAGKQ